jgi:hypothetical protein
MKKLYFLDEEEKNRILNIHESANNRQYLNERDAVQNDGSKLESIKSVLVGLGLTPLEKTTLPQGYWSAGTNDIPNLQVNTTLGWFIFISYKPGGYWTPNNFVLQSKNGVITIGTWDFDKLYMKKSGVVNVADKDFNDIIPLSQLKPVAKQPDKDVKQPDKDVKQPVKDAKKTVVDPKVAYQQRAKQVNQQTINTTKEIQKLLGQTQTGNLDALYVERLIDLLKQ